MDDGGVALGKTPANGNGSIAALTPTQFVHRGHEQSSSTRSHGVADRHGASIHIQSRAETLGLRFVTPR